ncbi:MAG TPA: FAD-dependent oxidoreductase, partial [Mycobacteriales bacterium]|nr:FAD-dependent oxidoreductase [Mycobacteriales bacterium]
MSRVVVVGGGIAGLAAAHTLAASGRPVTLLEATAAVGGKIRVSEIAGLDVDEGAESFVRRRPEGLERAAAVGLTGELVTPATTAASVWARGGLRPIPPGTVMGVPSDPRAAAGVLSSREVLRALADAALPRSVPAEGDVAVGPWIARRLGRAVVDRLV